LKDKKLLPPAKTKVDFIDGTLVETVDTPPPPPTAIVPAGGWRDELIWKADKNGVAIALQPILKNAMTILDRDERWAGAIALNEFSQIVEFVTTPPFADMNDTIWREVSRPVTDTDFTYIVGWISTHFNIHLTTRVVAEAVAAVAQKHRYHPVREYLSSLTWDGTERLSGWLEEYCGATSIAGNVDYVRKVGRAWMISAVARIYDPGCKADHVLILEGKQSIGKSTLFRTLAGEWFTDQIGDLGNKDANLQAQGVWIVELAELDAMSRHEVGRVKAFLSISFDRVRPPYGHTVMRYDRQCVFAGTVNHMDYLRDETGNRRFWPVRCQDERLNVVGLAADRDQLWAEAVAAYRAKEIWWLRDETEARVEQEDRMQADVWEEPIARHLTGVARQAGQLMGERTHTTVSAVLAALQIPVERQGLAEARRATAVLKRLGWSRRQVRLSSGVREWRYMAPEE
jgi:putative DNA primase/helicase